MARPIDALAPGERSGTPIRGYRSHLTKFPITIVSKRLIDRHGRIDVRRERIEDAPAISRDDPIACVATAPTPARTHGVTAPIAKYFD